jgi:hypothetical protein
MKPEMIQLAEDLCQYGETLSEDYRYPGEEPFADVYPSHGLFFRAQLGRDVDAAIQYFRHKLESTEDRFGAVRETLLTLYARLGKYAEAMELCEPRQLGVRGSHGAAPSFWELARRGGRFDLLKAAAARSGDVVAYAAALAGE